MSWDLPPSVSDPISRPSFGAFNRQGGRNRSSTYSQQARALLLPQEVKEIGNDNALIFYEGVETDSLPENPGTSTIAAFERDFCHRRLCNSRGAPGEKLGPAATSRMPPGKAKPERLTH